MGLPSRFLQRWGGGPSCEKSLCRWGALRWFLGQDDVRGVGGAVFAAERRFAVKGWVALDKTDYLLD